MQRYAAGHDYGQTGILKSVFKSNNSVGGFRLKARVCLPCEQISLLSSFARWVKFSKYLELRNTGVTASDSCVKGALTDYYQTNVLC